MSAILMYENGNAIGGEGHPTNASDITFDNTGTDLVSENVEDAIVEVNAKTSGLTRMTKLWENPSPTASFAAQTVTLSSNDYDFLMVVTNNGTSYIGLKGTSIYMSWALCAGSTYITNKNRTIGFTTDTQLSIGDGFTQNSNGNRAYDNNSLVPTVIYGIKII